MSFLDDVALGVGIIGVVVVGWGVTVGAFLFLRGEISGLARRNLQDVPLENIRFYVGRHLLLGLEFLIAADIMRTIAQPTLEQVTVLAVIVGIRTILSFFLTRDIEHIGK